MISQKLQAKTAWRYLLPIVFESHSRCSFEYLLSEADSVADEKVRDRVLLFRRVNHEFVEPPHQNTGLHFLEAFFYILPGIAFLSKLSAIEKIN